MKSKTPCKHCGQHCNYEGEHYDVYIHAIMKPDGDGGFDPRITGAWKPESNEEITGEALAELQWSLERDMASGRIS